MNSLMRSMYHPLKQKYLQRARVTNTELQHSMRLVTNTCYVAVLSQSSERRASRSWRSLEKHLALTVVTVLLEYEVIVWTVNKWPGCVELEYSNTRLSGRAKSGPKSSNFHSFL